MKESRNLYVFQVPQFWETKNFRGQRVDLNDLPGVAADEEAEQAFLGRLGDMKSKLGEI